MFNWFQELPEKKKKIIGGAGITVVIGSWLVVPLVAKIFYDISSIDVAMALTFFYAVLWFAHKAYRKYK